MILKISLKPLSPFYFGGENKFNEGDRDDRKDRRSTYLLRSNYFPQQTSILGMLRNQLLLQNGLLENNNEQINDKTAAKVLIGARGFQKGVAQHYGVIESLGMVFLTDEQGNAWLPAPLDDVTMEKDGEQLKMKLQTDPEPHLKGYSGKSDVYLTFRYGEHSLPLKEIFTEREQVGITKAHRPWGNQIEEKEDESGYYYQTFLQFDKSGSEKAPSKPSRFSFYVKLQEKIGQGAHTWSWEPKQSGERKYNLSSGIIEMGGQRSAFYMEVETTTEMEIPQFKGGLTYKNTARPGSVKSVVCLSPAFVDLPCIKEKALLIVSSSIVFRFLEASIDHTDHYQGLKRKDVSEKKGKGAFPYTESRLYQLLDRGSVIHFVDKASDEEGPDTRASLEDLFNQPEFVQIGYNQFVVI